MKFQPPKNIDPRCVYLDRVQIDRHRLNAGLSQKELADDLNVAWNTARAAFHGKGVFPAIAKKFADWVGSDVTDLLATYDPRYVPSEKVNGSLSQTEWEVAEYLGPGLVASNGLHFFVCQVKHRFVERRLGRGKFYHLSFLSTDERERRRQQVLRHPEVSARIGQHPHIAETESVTPVGTEDGWWVIDRWIGKRTLADLLASGPVPLEQLSRPMCEIARGLQALHTAKVVFRELAPSRVLLAEDDGRAVLTDFELAKLLDNAPTVSDGWIKDEFRAPEVDSGHADERADLYSWARLLVRAATGGLPESGKDVEAITQVGLPKAVWRVAVDCLSPDAKHRSKSIDVVLKAIERWT